MITTQIHENNAINAHGNDMSRGRDVEEGGEKTGKYDTLYLGELVPGKSKLK